MAVTKIQLPLGSRRYDEARPLRNVGRLAAAGIVGVLGAVSGHSYAAEVIYDSGGFAEPRFESGDLVGQDAGQGPWQVDAPIGADYDSQAVVQDEAYRWAGQALRIERTGNENPRWSVVDHRPDVDLPVRVSWDMKVWGHFDPAYGPYFGVEVWQWEEDGANPRQAAGFGLDAAAFGQGGEVVGELLYANPQQNGNLTLTPDFATAPVDTWNAFELLLDYQAQTWDARVNGELVLESVSFVDDGMTGFSDAPLVTSWSDAQSPSVTGTAFVDNYEVTLVPEPGSLSMLGAIGLYVLGRCRAR